MRIIASSEKSISGNGYFKEGHIITSQKIAVADEGKNIGHCWRFVKKRMDMVT
jgi:hypothetical protein